jgi:hypothetical protein
MLAELIVIAINAASSTSDKCGIGKRVRPYRTAARRKLYQQFEIGLRQCGGRICAAFEAHRSAKSEGVARDCAS